MEDKEIWRPVAGLEGIYEVSNKGRVRSLDRVEIQKNGIARKRKGRIIKTSIKQNGYAHFRLSHNGEATDVSVHRVVAAAFIPNPHNHPCINHKDGNRANNFVENIEWCTYKYNNEYMNRINRAVEARGCRKIGKYSKDGVLLDVYRSTNMAASVNRLSRGNLYSALHGKQKTCGGYKWKYMEGDTN